MTAIGGGEFRGRSSVKPDFILIGTVAALSALGLLMIFSASAPRLEAAGVNRSSQMVRQAVFVG
ncbi:MAG: hypothetical protein AAB198_03240, partial [Actinomycetota bacterium]